MRLLASLLFAFAMFAAAPAPAHAQEALGTLSAEGVSNVAGTRWQGQLRWNDGAVYDSTLYFRSDGVLEYGYNGQNYDNGRWLQNDAVVLMHTNRYFSVMAGTLSGDTISGALSNRRGNTGQFVLTPQGGAPQAK